MRYIFRKYISNRGSALFMVISTMTALMVSCMAMYFSMVSARASQYAVFNQMQANQTAQSVADVVQVAIQNALALGDNLDEAIADGDTGAMLRKKMEELDVNQSITTEANGFISLDPNNTKLANLDEDQIGAYAVTITRLKDNPPGSGNKIFDITVMSSVGGNRDAVHLKFQYNVTPPGEGDPLDGEDGDGGDAELFAATGYVPNDAYISGGYYLTDVFYDTQFTYMNMFTGSGENRIAQNLSTGGDLMIGPDAMTVVHSASNDSISSADVAKIGPVTWAIRGNFYPQFGSDFGMRGGSQVLVGGDFTFDSGNNSFYVKNDGYNGKETLGDHICVYVNGDLNYSGSDIKSNVWFFVNGDVYGVGNNKQSNARLFVTGATAEERQAKMHCSTNLPVEEWKLSAPFSEGLSYNEAMELLGQKTETIDYYKWDLSKNTESAPKVDIRINATDNAFTDDDGNTTDAHQNTFIFAYDENVDSAKYIKGHGGNENGVVGSAFEINSVWTQGDNNNGQAIIIDTGDDPNNIMTIKVADVTGNGEFSWFVQRDINVKSYDPYIWEYGTPYTPTGMINNNMRLVLVKGRGTVLIDVPKGITYQDAGYQLTGHIGWYLLEGGKIGTTGDGKLTFSGITPQGKYSAQLVPYVHRVCTEGDGCTYTKEKSATVKCNKCGGELTVVHCAIHGDVNKYCSACYPEKSSRTDWCKNHIDNKKFDEFYNSLADGSEEKKAITDSEGGIIYPNTNFMLVSCDESAEMLFSETKSGQNITNNTLFGFIYAPYMSYLAAGGAQAGGLVKLLGGMTVGDYDIRAIHSYIGCYPDKMPNEIAGMAGGGSMSGGKLKGTPKSWKIQILGY